MDANRHLLNCDVGSATGKLQASRNRYRSKWTVGRYGNVIGLRHCGDPATFGQAACMAYIGLNDVACSARKEWLRTEEHTYELQSLICVSYAAFCSKKKH